MEAGRGGDGRGVNSRFRRKNHRKSRKTRRTKKIKKNRNHVQNLWGNEKVPPHTVYTVEPNDLNSDNVEHSSYINLKVAQLYHPVLLDTGCYANICSKDFSFKLNVPMNKVGTYRRLYAANGSQLNVLGDIQVPIDIGGVLVTTRILVIENLGNPIILGLGFLQENKCQLDYASQKARFFNDLVQISFNDHFSNTRTAFAVNEVTIEPYSSQQVKVSLPRSFRGKDALVSCCQGGGTTPQTDRAEDSGPEVIESIITIGSKGQASCHMLNTSGEPVTITPGQPIARASKISAQEYTISQPSLKEVCSLLCQSENKDVIHKPVNLVINHENERQEYLHFVKTFFENTAKNSKTFFGRNSVNSVGRDQVTQTEPVTITSPTALKHEIVMK